MAMTAESENIIFIYVIVNRGSGSKVLHAARKQGLPGGTITLGRGTSRNPLLEALALEDMHREIVFLVTEETAGTQFITKLSRDMKFHKRNHGIAFTIKVAGVCGSNRLSCGFKTTEGGEQAMHQSVFIIVDRGRGEAAVEAAVKAGAKGATIVSARGSGIHETNRLFHMDIEPEKEIVLIILKRENTEGVVSSIRDALEIDKPGNGVIFVQNVVQVYGLVE
jgi:nitrogen regulatory protein PII